MTVAGCPALLALLLPAGRPAGRECGPSLRRHAPQSRSVLPAPHLPATPTAPQLPLQLPHVAQLMHLLPEALSLEWVRLPVAAHSSRTEPHLLINLDFAAAGEAALACGAARPGSELQAVRALLQCRLAGHLVGSYREHLAARASEARAVGDEAAAEELEAAAAAAADPPVTQWVPPYPEDAADVPEQQLPQRPDAASRGGSPAVLTGYAAAPGAHLALPSTPATGVSKLPPSTTGGRQGRPPMHPNTVDRQRVMHRRLSFGAAAAAAAAGEGGGAAPAATPSRAALAAAAGLASGCAAKPRTPLDKLASQLEVEAAANAQVHASQADLAASLAGEPGGLEWGASIPMSQEDASLLASMPEELRRMSTDGIISMDTLRVRWGWLTRHCMLVGGWGGKVGCAADGVASLGCCRGPCGVEVEGGRMRMGLVRLVTPDLHLCRL